MPVSILNAERLLGEPLGERHLAFLAPSLRAATTRGATFAAATPQRPSKKPSW